jgi:CMP/dCMP kinase
MRARPAKRVKNVVRDKRRRATREMPADRGPVAAVIGGGHQVLGTRFKVGEAVAATHLVIAIDGPAAAGKSTVASRLANRIDALFLDTGVIYRALTLAALEQGIAVDDAASLARLAASLPLRVTPPTVNDGRQCDVWLDERDVTWATRAPEVDRSVSAVSAHPEVRAALLDVQRALGRNGRVVMVGRDIGTVVMPDADLKIWLEASIDERARRRARDLERAGKPHDVEQVSADLLARDRVDAGRSAAPMTRANDAVVVDTDGLSIEEVVQRILDLVAESSCAV